MQAVHRRSVPVSRHVLLMGAAAGALALGALALPGHALAANECGAITTGTPDTVACFGNIAYPSGITYTDASANDLSVFIFGQTGIIPPVSVNSSGNGVSVSDTAGHNVTVTTYAGTSITAAGAYGIFATTNGAGDASIVSASSVNGATVFGVSARATGTGNATVVNSGAVTTASGATDALQAMTIGSGTATVVNSGALSGSRYGVWAGSLSSGNATVVNSAAVGATYRGLEASSLAGTGSVAIVNSGAVTVSGSGNGFALYGDAVGGSVAIVNSGALSSTHSGIDAHTGGTGNISVVDSAGISAAYDGIVATTSGNGTIGIALGNATNNANITATSHHGIFTTGYGTIEVVDHGTVTAGLSGIVAEGLGAGSGTVQVVTYGQIDATLDGVFASSAESGGIAVVEKGGITGHSAYGIRAIDTGASGQVDVVITGAVGSAGTPNGAIGVLAAQTGGGSGNVSITGAGNVYGTAGAIKAFSNGSGTVAIGVTGNATSTGASKTIWGDSTGTGAVVVSSSGTVHSSGVGVAGTIYNAASTAAVSVTNSGNVAMSGGFAGVMGKTSGLGAVTVTNTGRVDPAAFGTYGAILNGASTATLTVNNSYAYSFGTSDGVVAFNDGHGATVVNNSGLARTTGWYAIWASNLGGGNITVNNSGTAYGGFSSGGTGIFASTSGNTTINNSGSVFAATGQAIWTVGGPTTVNNAGRIYGHVHLSANSTVDNSDVWFAYGTSTFTAGNNVVNNSGAVDIQVGGATFTGLTTFNNAGGVVGMENGHTGEIFDLGGAAFVATGNSRFTFDANLTSPLAADELITGATSGATTVFLHDNASGSSSALNFTGVTVVSTTGGTGTFNMATYHKGFVDYRLVEVGTNWDLFGLPAANAFEMLKVSGMGQDFWRRTGDVWSAREQEVRDSNRQPGWEMWAQAFGGSQKDTRPSQTFSVGGFSFSPDLGTNADWRGFQMGGDQMTASHWLWGFTGGYMDQDSRFRALEPLTGQGAPGVHDGVDLTGWNIGVYGGWNSGGFFVNGLLKGDWFSADINMLSAGSRRDVDGNSWGAKGEMGFRWGGGGFWFEPVADIDWVSTHMDSVTMSGAGFSWADASSSKGEIGARIGGTWGSVMPYVGVYAVDQWNGNNKMTLLTGAGCPSCMTVKDTAPGSYGRADFGFTIANWNGLEGFLKGDALFGNHTEGYAGRLGVRWRW